MLPISRLCSAVALTLVVLVGTGCGTQPQYPNQLSTFDADTYDSLTLAHGALTSLRSQISSSYPKYAPVFNQAAAAYAAAYNSYAVYRAASTDTATIAAAVANLTSSIIGLEDAFQADLPVSKSTTEQIQEQAFDVRRQLEKRNVTVSTILTELEIAAAIARAVPGAQAAAGVALMVIDATSEALAEETAAMGQPINLETIQPVPNI